MRDIVLNEVTRAAELLAGTAKVEDVRTAISLVARYDVQAAGVDTEATKEHIRQVVQRLYPQLRPKYYERYIDYYVEHAEDYPLSRLDGVPITKPEMDYILSLDGIRAKCLAFSALAIAKCDTMRHPDVDYWVHEDRWTEMMKRANLTLSEDDMCGIFAVMYREGKIALPRRIDSYSIHVLYADNSGETVIMLHDADYRDLGYCLRHYLGEPYTKCEECGRWIKQAKNGRRRFCDECVADNHKRHALASYHRHK